MAILVRTCVDTYAAPATARPVQKERSFCRFAKDIGHQRLLIALVCTCAYAFLLRACRPRYAGLTAALLRTSLLAVRAYKGDLDARAS